MSEYLGDGGRPFSELRETGLLWLINRIVFHPRGYALALEVDRETGESSGWSLLGDGSEVWTFTESDDDEAFAKLRESGLLS